MALASPLYALFLLVVLLVAAILKRDWVAPFLLVASLVFYATGDLNGIPYLIAVIAIAYCGGLSLGRAQSARRLWLWVALTLAPLLFFKYAAGTKVILWLAGRLPWVLPADGGFQPLGISFFTFQAIAYLIDVYRRQFPPERNVLRVGLFLSFFPLVLAGPIERAPHLMPQLKKLNGWKTASDFEGGVFLILKGVFVKLVFADNFGIFVDGVYAQLSAQTPANAVTACYLYSAQIYCDFYGYTLIALGSARLLGIELINNFEHPYLAQSIQDFWKRWHISLTNWLRDYIFFSLGSVRKPWARYRNVLVTMLVCGVWHGAGLRFVLWGGVHGLAMVGNRLYESSARPYLSRIAPTLRRTARPLGTLMTFHFVTAAWVVFRAPNLTQASAMFAKIGQVFRFPFSPASPYGIFYWRLFAVFVAFELLDYTFDLRRAFQRSPAVLKAAWIILWFCSLYVSPLKTIKFVYYQF